MSQRKRAILFIIIIGFRCSVLLSSDLPTDPILACFHALSQIASIRDTNLPNIEWSDLGQPMPSAVSDRDGGSSASFRGTFRGKPAHIKLFNNDPKYNPPDRIAKSALIHQAFAAQGQAAIFYGITEFGDRTGIVSHFLDGATFVKSHIGLKYDQVSAEQLRIALGKCPTCRDRWIEKILELKEFLLRADIYIQDPQFALLPDGNVLLYDFDTYVLQSHDLRFLALSQVAIEEVVKGLREIAVP